MLFLAVWFVVSSLVPDALMQRERKRQQKEKPKVKRRASGLGCWESHFPVINLTFVPTYRETIRIVFISDCPWLSLGTVRVKPIRDKVQNRNQIPTWKWDSQRPRPFASGFSFCYLSHSALGPLEAGYIVLRYKQIKTKGAAETPPLTLSIPSS